MPRKVKLLSIVDLPSIYISILCEKVTISLPRIVDVKMMFSIIANKHQEKKGYYICFLMLSRQFSPKFEPNPIRSRENNSISNLVKKMAHISS